MKQLWQDICINCIHKEETCYVFEFPCLDYEPKEEKEGEKNEQTTD